jgi:CTP:molybdopterin cytidylyltransferase MocA
MNSAIPAIILAAGASRRLGQPKQLVRYNGETLLERAIRITAESGAAPILAVLGAHHEQISSSISFGPAFATFNPHWEQGIASSIHAGLETIEVLAPAASGALVLPCDQLRLSADHLRALLAAFAAQSETSIAASTYTEVLGIPAVFPRIAFAELLALQGDKGARALLLNPPCPVIEVPFAGGEIDIDHPADLDLLH